MSVPGAEHDRVPAASAQPPAPLILTGGPAVGKSTTAGLLVGALERAALIDVDDIRQLIRAGHAAPWDGPEGRQQLLIGVENSCSLAGRFLAHGFAVVIADVLIRDTLVLYRRLLPTCQVVRLYVTPEEATRRANSRPVHLSDREFWALHADDLRDTVAADRHLDVTGLTPDEQRLAVLTGWLGAGAGDQVVAIQDSKLETASGEPVICT